MNPRNKAVFEIYRPLRNLLNGFNTLDSLYVIWGYSRNYTFNYDFPNDIEKLRGFNPKEKDLHNRKYYGGLFDHELEFLLREIIINGDFRKKSASLKSAKYSIKLVNYLRGPLSDGLSKTINMKDNLFLEFNRLAHNQFDWQMGYSIKTVFRYNLIYSDAAVSKIIFDKLGLTPNQILLIGSLLFSYTGTNFITPLITSSTTDLITVEMINIYLSHFATTIKEVRQELKEYQQINENLLYTYNPLCARPIILEKDGMICPMPMLIFWQMTSGIYYCICDSVNFSHAFGDSFQKYVGTVLEKSCDNGNFQIYPEETFGKQHKRTSDWMVSDIDSILFIECKTKRMRLDSKTELDSNNGLNNDLKLMAGFITQLYKTYLDYKLGLYPSIGYDESKTFIPLVLTLEDWGVNFNHLIMETITNLTEIEFQKANLDTSLLKEFPFNIKCASEFENDIQLINELGIKDYFEKCRTNQITEYSKNFKFKDIYKDEYSKIFPN